jgi:hypothetical protein
MSNTPTEPEPAPEPDEEPSHPPVPEAEDEVGYIGVR